ncbi:MAG: hypothetical protein RI580_16475 [Halothece sp. Uz-M2-17]|nr:hypothetical protein [Halothece sp. Uz-M2-17]
MSTTENQWSSVEKEIAQVALEKARSREIETLIETVRAASSSITTLDDMWRLHDFLSSKRHELDGKYDDRESVLIFVFSQLVKEGWLSLEELDGLSSDKISKLKALGRM